MRHTWCFANEEANKSVKNASTNYRLSECVQRSNHIANLWKESISKDWNREFNCEILEQYAFSLILTYTSETKNPAQTNFVYDYNFTSSIGSSVFQSYLKNGIS